MAPEQRGEGGRGTYDEKVDMYALGTVLFDMWWDFRGRSVRRRNQEIKKISEEHVMDPECAAIIPENAQKLILQLVDMDPDRRPTAFQLLSSEQIPSAIFSMELLQKYRDILLNHKHVENIKLMHYLFSRPTPRDLDLSYEGGGLYGAILAADGQKHRVGKRSSAVTNEAPELPFSSDFTSWRDKARVNL